MISVLHIEKYNTWLNEKTLDEDMRLKLSELTESEIEECFYKELEFGTGGLRGLMGPGTNRINLYTIRKVTQGLANYLLCHNKGEKGVAISYDNRHHSQAYALEAAKVLAENNIKSYIFKRLRPTPMLSYAVRHFKAEAGIMITASHNPKEYNGYKVYNHTGAQLNEKEAEEVIDFINGIDNIFNIKTKENDLIHWIDESFDAIYLNEVSQNQINDGYKTAKIVYSPLHGTGGEVIPKFLKEQGFDVYVYEPQMAVDPDFSQTESSNPEEAKAYKRVIEYATTIHADIILLTDPDADRLGIAVWHENNYHLINGHQTASMMLHYILEQGKLKGIPTQKGCVFSTIVTTDLLKDIAESYEQTFMTTLTGFKYIGEQIELIKDIYTYTFGCEESYGSLVSSFVRDKDAVQAVYLLSEMACFFKEKQMTLIDYLKQIYDQYGYYHEHTENISLKGLEGVKKIEKIMSHYRENGLNLKKYPTYQTNDYQTQIYDIKPAVKLPKSNVLKYFFKDFWIVLRPSGTEPKLKIYYSMKADSLNHAKKEIESINQEILKQIETI